MRDRITTILEHWFIQEPALFQILCTHELAVNTQMACPIRSGKRRIEYNPDYLQQMTDQGLEEALRTEAVRILLKHPYERKPDGCSQQAIALGSKTVQTQAACLNRIYRKVNSAGLSADTIQDLRDDIEYIAELYHIDNQGAVLLAAILEKSATNNLMDDEDLAMYLGCTNIEFIRYHKKLRDMDKAGIIQIGGGRGGRRCYRVSPETLKAVESNGEFSPVKMSGLTTEEFFSRFRKFFGSFRNDTIDADRLLEELDSLVSYNDHLSFCKKALESALYSDCTNTERRMFYYICHRYVTHGSKSVDIETLTNFTEFMEDDECIKRRIANEHMSMQRSGLVSFAIEDGFVDTGSLSLSDKVKAEFFNEVVLTPEETVRHRDIVSAETIQEKELFFNEAESAQVARLENLLDAENSVLL